MTKPIRLKCCKLIRHGANKKLVTWQAETPLPLSVGVCRLMIDRTTVQPPVVCVRAVRGPVVMSALLKPHL